MKIIKELEHQESWIKDIQQLLKDMSEGPVDAEMYLISLIQSLLASQKQEIIAEVEGTKKHKHLDNCNLQEISPEKCGWCLASNLHYNRALQDFITNLTK